ncbi:hypothetical protein ABIE24_001162 [Mycetocola sp. 2940]
MDLGRFDRRLSRSSSSSRRATGGILASSILGKHPFHVKRWPQRSSRWSRGAGGWIPAGSVAGMGRFHVKHWHQHSSSLSRPGPRTDHGKLDRRLTRSSSCRHRSWCRLRQLDRWMVTVSRETSTSNLPTLPLHGSLEDLDRLDHRLGWWSSLSRPGHRVGTGRLDRRLNRSSSLSRRGAKVEDLGRLDHRLDRWFSSSRASVAWISASSISGLPGFHVKHLPPRSSSVSRRAPLGVSTGSTSAWISASSITGVGSVSAARRRAWRAGGDHVGYG